MNQMRLLLITPDYSLNGANTTLLELVPLLKERGYQLYAIGTEDGPFRKMLYEAGVETSLQQNVPTDHKERRILQTSYDSVFLNSASVHYYSLFFQNTDIPVYWWFHESEEQIAQVHTDIPHLLLLSQNFRFLAVTERVRRGLRHRFGCDAGLLPMAIAQVPHTRLAERSISEAGKTVFFIPAAYTYIKGQDLLLQAILDMPEEYRKRASFVFSGYPLPGQQDFLDKIRSISEQLSCITLFENLPRNEVYQWYEACDCVIAPSRIDSTPTTIVEAMMFHRLCIASTGTGISEYMADCIDGFVYPAEDTQELLKRLLLIIEDKEKLYPIAEKGHMVYKTYFSPESVKKRLAAVL